MLCKNEIFHDLVFKHMNNRNEHDCQDLASQVLKCFYFCNSVFPSCDHDCNIQDFAFQVLTLFGVNNFNTKRLLKMSFMTQDLVFQDMNTIGFVFEPWQPPQFFIYIYIHILYIYQNLASQVLKRFIFCNSMFPSLDNDSIIQDLAFQVLNPFGVFTFSIRPKKELCFS